jgi:hypothetical protein
VSTTKTVERILVGEHERAKVKELYLDATKKNLQRLLSDWEHGFIKSIYEGSLKSTYTEVYWTEKQISAMDRIEGKLYAT